MTTRSETLRSMTERGRAEHIAIEGEPFAPIYPVKQPHRIARSSYRLASTLHGCSTELALLDGHYLRVHSARSIGTALKYQFDLRYANPRPVRVRHIAWSWLAFFITCAAIAAGALSVVFESGVSSAPMIVAGVAVTLALLTLFLFLRRTTESLEFRSEHGMATLVAVTGGLGSVRKGKPFFVELIKSINAAKNEQPESRQQFLCGEMREHHRLLELGVLSQREYEQSKARILAQH